MMRIKELDIAKGICIILVVLGHFFPEGAPHWYAVMRSVIYSFHMPVFMFVSGFVYIYAERNVSYGTFLLKKVRRIAVPYFLVSCLFIAIKLIPQALSIYVKNPVTLSSFLKVFYYPEAAVSFWYLWALWWFFMLVPLLRTRGARLIALGLSLAVASVSFELPDIFALPKAKEMLPYFMMGAVAADWRHELSFVREIPSWAVYLVFAVSVVLGYGAGVSVGLLMAVSGICMVLRLSSDLVPLIEKGRYGWLDTVSRYSYTIYLFHPVFVAGCLAVLKMIPLTLSDGWLFALIAAVVTAVGTGGPMAIRMISERVFSRWRGGSAAGE